MEKKDLKKLALVFVVILLMAVYVDVSGGNLSKNGTLERDRIGGDEKQIQLLVNIDGVMDAYEYSLALEPEKVTKDVADTYLAQAVEEIQESFIVKNDALEIKGSYASDFVEAEWSFSPGGYVYSDGTLRGEKIPEDGVLLQVMVTLECGEYEQIYGFPFLLEKPKASKQQQLLNALEQNVEMQMQKEGTTTLQLPTEINGYSVEWSEKKDYLTLKILALELVAGILLFFMQKKKEEKEKTEIRLQMELDYPEVVNQLSILLGAGMTTRQAWERIASQYENKKKANLIEDKIIFEEILMMNHRLREGENERVAYEGFIKNVDHPQYRRLIRTLVNNMEKGTKGICEYLEEESRQAYEQRILLAKRLGEEASTKMLVPMMLMMVLVMAIVMVPALISFSI